MRKPIFILIVLWLSVVACIEPYDVSYNLNAKLLTIDAIITDQDVPSVSIAYSTSSGRSNYGEPIKGCTVDLLVNGTALKLNETTQGTYVAPSNTKGIVGNTYQLKFKLPDGKQYESTIEKLNAAPKIDKVYHVYNRDGMLNSSGVFTLYSTTDVFLDFKDPAETQNYYLWKTTLFEAQDICITCEKGLYQPGRGCVATVSRNPASVPTYDYKCQGACWDILSNSEVVIQSDQFSNGKANVGKIIQKVPYYRTSGGLIEIRQYGITPNAFRYYDLLRQQGQSTGTLTDTPPAPLIGNIRNPNDGKDIVVGYFTAAGVSKIRYWIDRTKDKNPIYTILLGYEPNLEPDAPPFRPPTVPCEPTPTRTPIKPLGWGI